jgi:hypothetical protein
LSTSIVLPFMARTTSPGLVARPPGMFSVVPTTPTTRQVGRTAPERMPWKRPSTAAEPHMS